MGLLIVEMYKKRLEKNSSCMPYIVLIKTYDYEAYF